MRATLLTLCLAVALSPSPLVWAGEASTGSETSLADKIGDTAKKIGKKIEEGITKTAKKIEEKRIPEKVERKLKKAADKTAEGFGKAEKKLKQTLAD
jgi:hypothetical protein